MVTWGAIVYSGFWLSDPQEVFADIFAFDWHDQKLREQLGQVLLGCGFQGFEVFQGKGKQHGDAKRRLPKEIVWEGFAGCSRRFSDPDSFWFLLF